MSTLPEIVVPPKWRGPRRRDDSMEETAARNRWMVDLINAGHPMEAVAYALGISLGTVMGIRSKLDPVRKKKAALREAYKVEKVRRNPLPMDREFGYQMRKALSIEAQDWLIAQCPDGVAMADFIASIITDAHQEETDGA